MLLLLIRAGMVLTNIRIWRDFIITRDSGIVPMELDLTKKSKKTQKDKKPKTNPIVFEKDSEETVLLQDSEETFTDKEQTTHQNQPNIQSYKAQSSSKLLQNERFQKLFLSVQIQKKKKSEPEESDKELWKFGQ